MQAIYDAKSEEIGPGIYRFKAEIGNLPFPSLPFPSLPVPSRPVPSRPVPSLPFLPCPSLPVPSRPCPSLPFPFLCKLSPPVLPHLCQLLAALRGTHRAFACFSVIDKEHFELHGGLSFASRGANPSIVCKSVQCCRPQIYSTRQNAMLLSVLDCS